MKHTARRILSLLCVMAMLFTCLSGLTFTVGAERVGTEKYPNKWTIYKNDGGLTLSYQSGGRFEKSFSGFGAQLPENYELADVALYIRMTLDSAAVAAFEKGGSIELCQATMDNSERSWSLAAPEWKVGENEILLNLATSGSTPGGTGELDIHKPMNYVRMFANPGSAVFTAASTVTIYEITLVDVTTAGVTFGDDDTYLQLSAPLTATPNTIEASVKMNGMASEWSIGYPNGGRYLSESADVYDKDGNANAPQMVNIGVGYAASGLEIPAGTPYYAVTVNKGAWTAMANQTFKVDFPKAYSKEDLALAFWLYTETGEIPTGYIELTSSGTWDKEEISFTYANYIENPKAGWNYVELPLAEPSAASVGTAGVFDYTKANFIRWVGSTGMSTVNEIRVSEMKFIVLNNDDSEPKGWPLCNGFAASGGFNTGWSNATSAVTWGNAWETDAALDVQPPSGTVYAEFKSNGKTNESGTDKVWCPVFTSSFDALELPNGITLNDMVFSGWFYISDADLLLTESPWFWINSNGDPAKGQLSYGNLFKDFPLSDGWNYIEIPLSDFTNGGNPQLDLTNISLFNLRAINVKWVGSTAAEQAVIRYADFRLTAPDFVEEPSTTEGVVSEDDYVIFSNTNTADENPIALLVDMYGDVCWVWGDTRYETDVNVRIGEWVDLALVRDMSQNAFILYTDGVKAAQVDATGTADIVPTAAHCIGGDGQLQSFKGMIADVRAWSDVRTAEEIANNRVAKAGNKVSGLTSDAEGLIDAWFLHGDLNYVLGGTVTNAIKGNTLTFLGSRADDWEIEYEIPTDVIGEDYYTMVFIPDTQELVTGAFTEEWMAAAQWIADNVEKENIVHVIGAGDNTWTDSVGQWNIAKAGWDLFTDKVSWSNMTGNHDYPGSCTSVNNPDYIIRNSTNYNNAFGLDYINATAAKNTYCGSFADDYDIYGTEKDANGKYSGAENSYYRFTVNGVNWMILQIEYHPRVSVINWACDILEQYPDDNVIFTTHGYIGGDNAAYSTHWMPYTKSDAEIGGYIGELMPSGAAAWPGGSEQPVWTEIVKKHDNVKMLLCGHASTTDGHVLTRWDENDAGNVVPQVMINAQDVDVSYFNDQAMSMLGVLRFSADGTKVDIQYYSPYHGASFHPSNQEMRSLTLTTRTCDHSNTENRPQQDPTCTEVGYTAGVWCIPCGRYVEGGEVIPAHEKEDRAEVAPTCTEIGYTAGVWCTVCEKYVTGGEEIAAHEKQERAQREATCTKDGYTAGVWCTVCKVFVSGGEVLPCHPKEQREKVPSTCTEPGVTAGEWCTVCEKYTSGGVTLPVHLKEERAEIPATETTDGRTAGVWCIPCEKYVSGGEIIPATGSGETPPPPPAALLGDVDGNKKVDSTDARLVLQYAVKKIDATALNTTVADVNADGKVDSTDARLILQFAVKKIDKLPAAK